MNIKAANEDILKLEKSLKLIETTVHYTFFKKAQLIFDICEAINQLKDKRDGQIEFLKTLK